MAKYEFKTHDGADVETINASHYSMNTKDGNLTFYDTDNNQVASYHIAAGAYVKRVGG